MYSTSLNFYFSVIIEENKYILNFYYLTNKVFILVRKSKLVQRYYV